MNPKTGLAIGILGLIFYVIIMMMRGDPEERYRAIENMERGVGSVQTKSEPQFKSYMAYQLHVESVDPETNQSGYVASDIQEALWEALKPEIKKPYGLNPDFGEYKGEGSLGTFQAVMIVKERGYKESGSQSFQTWSIPYFFELTLTVTSKRGKSTWDGTHVVSVEKEPPSELLEGTLSMERTRHIKKMAQDLVQQIALKGTFKRD